MKRLLVLTSIFLSIYLLIGCGTSVPVTLCTPTIQQNEPINNYKYFFITPTTEVTSSYGGISGNNYGVFGSSMTQSFNPSDVISGILLKQGYARLPELNNELLEKTLIVNYGESGRRVVRRGYTTEITIQFLSAKTHSIVCVCTAEGYGLTEADDIKIAVNRALEQLFRK